MEIDSIPVILDDIRKYDRCYMSRCTYFIMESDLSVESNALSPNWMLVMQALNVPFYLLGLSGIIWKPLGDSYVFDSPDSIRDLFDAIDSSPLLGDGKENYGKALRLLFRQIVFYIRKHTNPHEHWV